MGLKLQRRKQVRAHLMGAQYALHSFHEMLDFIPASFRQDIEKFPGTPVKVADIDAPATQKVEPALVKTVEASLFVSHLWL